MSTKHAVDFRAVKQAVSIAQILDHYGLTKTFKPSQNGDSLSGPCPLHGGHNQTQFRVSLSKNCWNCFGDCKSGGNILDFVCRKEDCTLREAAILISGWFNIPSSNSAEPKRDASSKNTDSPSTASVRKTANDDTPNKPLGFELQRLDTAHPYLAERGLDPDTIAHFGIGYCSNGSMAGRIVIPIFNPQAELVAYAGRWPGEPADGTPKYKLPAGFKKSLELFNLDRALAEPADEPLVIVEGFFDCIKLWQNGVGRVVALMGSSLSDAQTESLIQHLTGDTRLLVILDEDEAGRAGRAEIVQRLAPHFFVKALALDQEGRQPETLSADELAELIT